MLRIAIFQKRLSPFRIPVFARLAAEPQVHLTVAVAEPPRHGAELPFDCVNLTAWNLPLTRMRLLFQPSLVQEASRHDVVIVEGSLRVLTSLGLILTKPLHRAAVVWWTALYNPKIEKVSFPRGPKAKILERTLRRTDGVLTYSQSAAEAIRTELPLLQNVVVAPNVLDTDELVDAERRWTANPEQLAEFARECGFEGRAVILFVGRLIPPKRLDDLVRMFMTVRSEHPGARALLAIVGDGPERQRIQQLVTDLGVSSEVRFFGDLRDPYEVCPFFLHARAFVLPGAGGLAIYHALALGVPVVATHADGTERDLVTQGLTGFLCEPGDVSAIARYTSSLLSLDDGARQRISAVCRSVARDDFHVNTMVGQIVAVAEHAVSGKSRPRSDT